jgi:hypothetical protein
MKQRLDALERHVVVLQDTMKLLHRLLKQQRELINDYITEKVTAAAKADRDGSVRPEEALYTFRCRQRFDKIEKDIGKIEKMIENSRSGLKAG